MKRSRLLAGALVAALLIVWGVALVGAGSAASTGTQVRTKTVAVAAADRLRPGVRLTLPATYRSERVTRFQWLRCDRRGSDCKRIARATRRSYVVRMADVGHTLRARITTQGSATATTNPTQQVGRPLPKNTAVPTLTDDCAAQQAGCLTDPTAAGAVVTVGDNLIGTNGTWQHAVRFTYQWEDCVSGGTCTPIANATSPTYTVQDSDVGDTLVFVVTAYNF